MDRLDNSLETGGEPSVTTLESDGTGVVTDPGGFDDIRTEIQRQPVFRYNRTALTVSTLAVTLILIIALAAFGISSFLSHRANSAANTGTANSAQPAIDYSVGSIPVQGIKPSAQLKVGEADQLSINGQLRVSNTLVISPGKAPSSPVPGQIYYDQTTKQPYYYNGSQFIGLAPTAVPQHVTSLGGAAGVVGLGEGLQVVGDQLSVSESLLQTAANAGTHTTGVTSIQGQKGAVTLNAGSGINVNGTTISNGGVLSLTGSPNQVAVSAATGSILLSLPQDIDTNADARFNSLTLGGGDLTLAAAAQINTDSLNTINSGDDLALNADGNFTFTNVSGANSFVFPTSGGPGQVICTTVNTCGAGGGQNVLLEPTGVQTASANKTAIFINKSGGTGDLIDLQDGGTDALVIDNAGNTTIGKLSVTNGLIANSLTTSTITSTSALTVGATSQSLTLQGNTLSIVSTNGTNATTVGFSGAQSSGNIAYNFDRTAAAGTYTICTTIGNCAGVGGSITGSGTANKLAEFTGSGSIGNSPLTDAGGNLSSAGSLAAVGLSAGSGLLQGSGGLTVTGATGINTTGTANTSIGNAIGTFAVVSSGLNVTTAGALSGITTIGTSGTINGATIASTGINGAAITSTTFNTATISGGSLSGSAVDGLGVSATAITPTGALTVGTAGQNLTLQGSGVSVTSSNGTNATTVGFGGTQAAGNITYNFDQTAAAGTYTVCTTVGNCVGVGGGITGSGTNGDIAKFTGTGTIANSGLSESGTTLTYGGNAIVNAGAGFNGNLLNLEVNGGSKLAVDQAGNLTGGTINGATINSTSFNGATINSTSFNGAAINSTSFNTATISGGSLTGGSISAGTITGGTLSGTTVNGLGISATNITPTGALTVGTIGQNLTLQGNSVSTVSSNGTNTTTVGFSGTQAAGNITYNFDRTVAAGAYTICTTIGNCAGSGGGITGSGANGDIAKFTGTGTIANSNLSESGTTLTYAGNAIVNAGPGFSGNLLNLEVNSGSKLSVDQAGDVTASGTINTATISGGSLSSSAVDGLGVSGTSVTGTSTLSLASTGANTATLDTGGASTLNLGNANATTIQLGRTSGTVPTLSLQGNTVSVVSSNGTNSTTVGFTGSQAAGNIIYNFDRTVAAGTYTICTTIGNCAGSGGGITGAGTSGKLAEFTGTGTIGNSPLTDTSGNLSTSGTFAVQGGNLSLGIAGTANGAITFNGTAGTHTVTLQAPSSDPASDLTFTLPDSYGNNGDCLLSNGGGGLSFAACPGGGGGSGVTTLDAQAGILTLANSSGASGTITIDDASTTQKGIAEFNSTNFSASAGTINTIQDIATTSSPKFATVNTTTGVNTGAGSGTQRVDASGNLVNIGTIATSSTINGATIASTGINGATINSTSFNTATISGGSLTGGSISAGTITGGTLSGTAVNSLNVSGTAISGTSTLSVASTGANALTLDTGGASTVNLGNTNATTVQIGHTTGTLPTVNIQGNAVSVVSSNGTNSTTVGFTGTQAAGNITYNFDRTVAAGAYTICTTIGNCAGSGGGITGSGTAGKLAEFNGTGTITNSPLTDTAGNLTTAGSLAAVGLSAGTGLLQGTGGLTLTGATSINATGTANTSIGNATGTFALASSGLNVTTAGALTGITTLTTSSTINGATIASTGINGATINSTSFNTATISGGSLTGGSISAGTITGGTLSGTAVNSLNVSGTAISGTSTLSVASTGANALTLDTGGASTVNLGNTNATTVQIGHTTGTLPTVNIQGNAVSVVSSNGTNSTTVGFTGTQAAGNITYNFDRTVAAGAYTICTTIGNCAGSGGGITGSGTAGKLAEFNGTGTITNSPLTDTAGNLTTAGSLAAVGLSAGTGLLQGTGGLTLTGATSINATGTANTSIGNATGTFALASSGLNVTTAGALTGITTLTTSSTINGATIASTGINGATINSTSFNTATISGGSLTGGSISAGTITGGTLSGTAVNSLNVSGTAISGTSTLSVASTGANALTLDTGGASTVNLGNTNATTVQIGHTTGTLPTVNIQGNAVSVVSSNGTNSTTVGFTGTQAAGNITYNFDRTVAAGAYTICTTIGNCAGSGGGITGSGTAGKLAEFNGTGTITNSPLTDTAGNLTTAGSLAAVGLSAGTGLLQGTGGLTLTGATSINATGTANTSIGNATGTFALASSGLNVTTAGALTGITTLTTSSTINGATIASTGINGATINSTSFNTATISGGSLTGGSISAGTITGGTLSGTAVNSLNVSGTAISGTSTLSVASTGANALTLDTGGASTVNLGNTNATTVQIGHTTGTLPTVNIQGNAVSVVSSNGTNSTTVGFTGTQAAGNITYNFDRTVAAGAYTICTTANNCNGVSGTNFYLQQVPTSNSANTAGADVISPTTNGISGLIVNGTTGTAATAASIVQGGAATALAVTSSSTGVGQDIELTNAAGTQSSGLLINRNGTGTTTNVVNVTNTAGTATSLLNLSNSGTATNAIALSGTYTNLINSTNFNVSNAGAVSLQGNQTADITTPGAGTANKLTIQPGASTTVSGTGANLVLDGGNQTGGTASIGGSLNLDAGTGVTNGAINIGSTNDAAIFLGKTTGTSTITAGQSTASNAINIGNANTATGNTQTINLGNGTEAGTGKAAITIGNLANASSTTIQGGSGNINLNVNQTGAGVVVKTITNNSAVALQIQNSSSNAVLTVDTSFNSGQGQLILGKASTNNGQLLFQSSGGTNTIGLAAPTTNPGSSYVLNLPTTAPGTSQCLESGASTATQLIFSSCGSSITLQGAYNTSAGAAPSIVLTGANKAFTIQNDNTTGIAAGSEVFGVHANAGSNALGTSLFSVATTGDTGVTSSDTTSGTALSVTTAVTGGTALNVTANSVNTTNAVNVSANGLTTGNGVNIATTSVVQSAGSLLNVTNTGILNNNGGTDTANLLNVSRAMSVSVSGGLATPTLDTGATNGGAVEFANGTAKNGGALPSTVSLAFTLSANTNRYLLVTVEYEPASNSCTTDKPTATYVTSMTFLNLDDDKSTTGQCLAYFGMVAPSAGASHNVVLGNMADDLEFGEVASSWFNVNQSTPTSNFSDSNGSGTSSSLTATSTSGQIMVDMLGVASSSGSGTPSAGSGQTAVPTPINDNTVFIEYGDSYKAASSSTTPMGWTGLVSSIWDEAAIGLNGSGSVGFETVAGAVASFSNSCTVSVGTCVDASNILSLNQQYASSTGTVLNIQNAGTGDLIDLSSGGNMVDSFSNNGTLTVGQSGGTSTPALVVLGGSTSSGDPAEVDGAMYYSTTMNAYRCGTNGFWSNCAVNNIQNSFNFTDDFMGGASTATGAITTGGLAGIGSLGWGLNEGSSGTCNIAYNPIGGAAPTPGHDHPGVLEMIAGVGSGSECGLNQGGSALATPTDNGILAAGDDLRFTAATTTGHGIFRVGYDDVTSASATTPKSGVWFEYNTIPDSTHWRFCYGNNVSGGTCASTTDTITGSTWYSMEIRIISSSAVTFIITPAGGTPEVHVLTGLSIDLGSTNKLGPNIQVGNAGTSGMAGFIDYYQYTGYTTATGGR